MFLVSKSTSINLRITPQFRAEMEILADYYGLTLSSYAHSLLVRDIRKERESHPELFKREHIANGIPVAPRSKTGGIRMKIENPKTEKVRRTKGGAN